MRIALLEVQILGHLGESQRSLRARQVGEHRQALCNRRIHAQLAFPSLDVIPLYGTIRKLEFSGLSPWARRFEWSK